MKVFWTHLARQAQRTANWIRSGQLGEPQWSPGARQHAVLQFDRMTGAALEGRIKLPSEPYTVGVAEALINDALRYEQDEQLRGVLVMENPAPPGWVEIQQDDDIRMYASDADAARQLSDRVSTETDADGFERVWVPIEDLPAELRRHVSRDDCLP